MSRRVLVFVALLTVAALGYSASAIGQGGSSDGRKALFGNMNGRKEVSAQGQKGVGDRNGRGSFSATAQGNRLCYGITVAAIATPVAAHIHRGGPNVAGPIVIPLTQPTSGSPGASSACVTVDRTLLRAILRNPHRYYVNVHTGDFPGGAVRSQLFARAT